MTKLHAKGINYSILQLLKSTNYCLIMNNKKCFTSSLFYMYVSYTRIAETWTLLTYFKAKIPEKTNNSSPSDFRVIELGVWEQARKNTLLPVQK